MFRINNALIFLAITALLALFVPLASPDVGLAQGGPTPTPAAPPPIVVGRMVGLDQAEPRAPTVGPLTFASELNAQGLAADQGVEFPAGTQAVYVFFEYQGFAPGSSFEQVWFLDGNETARDQWAWDGPESGLYRGGLNRAEGLSPGDYRLDILVDGQVLGAGAFVIAESVAPTGPWLGPIVFAQGAANGQPVSPAVQFPVGTKSLYAFFDFVGIPAEAEFSAALYWGDRRVMAQSKLWDLAESGQMASLNLSSEQGYRAGQYRLVLSIDGAELQSGEFVVAGEQAAEPTAVVALVLPTATPAPSTPTPESPPTAVPTSVPTARPPAPSPTPKVDNTAKPFKVVYTKFENNFPSIWLMNLDGSEQRKLADHASDPTFSPDGSRVVFFGYDAAKLGRGIYQMKLDGSEMSVIWNEGTARYLDWSPAGPYVAMTALNAVIVYDGRAGRWQTISKGEQPSFAPDGARLVAKSCDGGDCGLFTMNRDGGDRRRITSNAEDAMPAWSPTFKRIAFASQRDGNWDIYSMNVDGGDEVRLTDDPGIDAMPAWLPDGSAIVFRSTRGGAWGVWIMNPDGSEPRKVVDAPATEDWGRSRLDVR